MTVKTPQYVQLSVSTRTQSASPEGEHLITDSDVGVPGLTDEANSRWEVLSYGVTFRFWWTAVSCREVSRKVCLTQSYLQVSGSWRDSLQSIIVLGSGGGVPGDDGRGGDGLSDGGEEVHHINIFFNRALHLSQRLTVSF